MKLCEINPRKVIVSREDVADFNRRWPGSCLDSRRHYWFEFDANGDLIDTDVPEHTDGPEATALCGDAWEFLEDQQIPDKPADVFASTYCAGCEEN